MLSYEHTERQRQRLMQVNGDAPKSVPDLFQASWEASPCISMDLAAAARCVHTLKKPPVCFFPLLQCKNHWMTNKGNLPGTLNILRKFPHLEITTLKGHQWFTLTQKKLQQLIVNWEYHPHLSVFHFINTVKDPWTVVLIYRLRCEVECSMYGECACLSVCYVTEAIRLHITHRDNRCVCLDVSHYSA